MVAAALGFLPEGGCGAGAGSYVVGFQVGVAVVALEAPVVGLDLGVVPVPVPGPGEAVLEGRRVPDRRATRLADQVRAWA